MAAATSLFFFSPCSVLASFLCFLLLSGVSLAADPFVSYDFKVSYITASPLGVRQQVLTFFLPFSRKSRVRCFCKNLTDFSLSTERLNWLLIMLLVSQFSETRNRISGSNYTVRHRKFLLGFRRVMGLLYFVVIFEPDKC